MTRLAYLRAEIAVWNERRRKAASCEALRSLYLTPELDAALGAHVRELHTLCANEPKSRRRTAPCQPSTGAPT